MTGELQRSPGDQRAKWFDRRPSLAAATDVIVYCRLGIEDWQADKMAALYSFAAGESWEQARKMRGIVAHVVQKHTSPATRLKAAILALAKHDSTFGQVVRRELHADAVARDDADKMLPHPAGNMRHDEVAAFNLHAESRVG